MKKFFGSRGGAIVVAVIVVLLGTYFGAMKGLTISSREIADGFSVGVDYKDADGNQYLHKSIRSQLVNRSEAALNLVSVANNFPEVESETAALRSAANTLRDLLYTEAGPRALYEANAKVEKAFQALSPRMDELELDKRDLENVEAARVTMREAAATIEEAGYNESVRRFDREVLSIFPTNFFKTICGVQGPELFDVTGSDSSAS